MSYLDAARDLAEKGYHVFPCRPRGKEPKTEHGFKEASRDERTILDWWSRWPDANIGIACGASGIVVLDIDPKHGADPREAMAELDLEEHPVQIWTGEAPEPSDEFPNSLAGVRGAHLYFAGDLRSSKTATEGVEFRGVGSYVIAPGSGHPSGVPYEGNLPPVQDLPFLPDRIAALVNRRGGIAEPIPDKISHGRQHDTLVSMAGTMRRRGADENAIYAALSVMNRDRCEVPGPDENIRKIATSAMQWEPASNGAGRAYDFKNSYDKDGRLKLPDLPDDPPPVVLCAWLTAALELDRNYPITGGRWLGARGPTGHVALDRAGAAKALMIEPASVIVTPMKLLAALTGQRHGNDRPWPPIQGTHCRILSYAIERLCDATAAQDEVEETLGIVGTFLSQAVLAEGHFTTRGLDHEHLRRAGAVKRNMPGGAARPQPSPAGDRVVAVELERGGEPRTARRAGG